MSEEEQGDAATLHPWQSEGDGSAAQPSGGSGPHKILCLLTTLHPESNLSWALVQHLSQEMPDIEFTLDEERAADVIWVCGYEQGNANLICSLRANHKSSLMVVTGRSPSESWEAEVQQAGADCASAWPIAYPRLSELFHRRREAPVA